MDGPSGTERTAILGLGNPLVGDDRIGLAVAQAVAALLREHPIPGVDVLESTRGGLELMDLLGGYRRAIIIDCMVTGDPRPGQVHRFPLARVQGDVRLLNAHEIGIHEVFRLAQALDVAMPAEVEIVGIEGLEMGTLTERMTPVVEAVVEPLAREIHASLL